MDIKFYLIVILLMAISAAWAGWSLHLYLADSSPINMICAFVSVAAAVLLLITIGKEL